MKKVLVISGHTDLATSVANKTILDTIGQYLPETEIVKLDTLYPDFKIDESRHYRVAISNLLVQRTLHTGTLDGRNIPARLLSWQYRQQTERQKDDTLIYHRCPARNVFSQRGNGVYD